MRSSSFEKMLLDCFSLSICTNTCLCSNLEEEEEEGEEEEDGFERKALVENDEMKKLKDFFDGKSLAFHLEPKTIVLKVSMHCQGCAKKVKKHIAKIEGVRSFEVDLENKKVVVMGDISPLEVLQSVSKIKFTELVMVN